MDPVALYEEARAREGAQSGHYNRNVRVEADSGPVLVRMRADAAEAMDLTLWPEADVLGAIAPYVPSAPRLLHTESEPAFQVHEFVEGRRVDEVHPDGKPLPESLLDAIGSFFGRLLGIPSDAVPPVPADWPPDGDTAGFALRLLDLVHQIRHRADPAFAELYAALGVPDDPCVRLRARAAALTGRPFRLLHADVHRKNMILARRGGLVVLDWELALWGDPVYDLADHVHKMSYTPSDRVAIIEAWRRAAPRDCRRGLRADLDYYLAHEAVKSAVVDTVRWGRRVAAAPSEAEARSLASELAAKLAAAQPHWADEPTAAPAPENVREAVHRCLG
ncbi:aminoglycoside phosphotransferase family protein [Streptomyces sp. NPDC015131]|uniref:aminoglycoside phosphotransferase family protein n=1 Tax=Streptomyces sp. NPDC015131 TaxID=3364941 RepID=UPI0037029DED